MKLTFHERYGLLGILPQEEDYATLRIAYTARLLLAPSAEEIQEFEIRQDGPNIVWNLEKARDYLPDVPLDDSQITMLRKKLIDLDRSKKLTPNTYSVFEKFVLTYQQL